MKVTVPNVVRVRWANLINRRRVASLAHRVARVERTRHPLVLPATRNSQPLAASCPAPVVFFNASTRLYGLSLNAAFALLASWSLRLSGVPVVHFVCQAGMKHCVLGTKRLRNPLSGITDYFTPPPCAACMAQSHRLYAGAQVHGWSFQEDPVLNTALQKLSIPELSVFQYPISNLQPSDFNLQLPLGRLVLPSVRWALRMFSLPDDEPTRYLMRAYITSANCVAREFANLLAETRPATVVIFNGALYPEATARWVADQMGVRSVAHEVGFQRYSAFFTEGEPTAYPIKIPDEFELSPEQDRRLEAYLEKRFQGKFSMAGIQFWPEMRSLDQGFLHKAAGFKQIVPVFTNVAYDTSQVHANVVFPHMFAWLDLVAGIIREHPETLFVIRAHPDEMRPGKISQESVQAWVERTGQSELSNVVFIPSREFISSYELIQLSKFVMVYNSSIGLEATLLGRAVLCGGKARYTQYPIVLFPTSIPKYQQQAEDFLEAAEVEVPVEFQRNARRFLYYQLYRTSLPLDEFIEEGMQAGFVHLRRFSWMQLLPENSMTMRILSDGILQRQTEPQFRNAGGEPFILPEN